MGFGRAAGGSAAVMVWLEIEGRRHKVELPGGAASGAVECVVDGRRTTVDVRVLEAGVMSLVVGGRQYRCVLDGDGVVIGRECVLGARVTVYAGVVLGDRVAVQAGAVDRKSVV